MVKVLLLLPTTIHCIFFLLWPLAWLEQGLALPTISTSQQQKVNDYFFDKKDKKIFKMHKIRTLKFLVQIEGRVVLLLGRM